MKFCPVCKSNVFDDMDTCFNCLHKFSSEKAEAVQQKESSLASSDSSPSDFVECSNESGLTDFLSQYYTFLGQYIESRKFDLQR